MAQGRVRDLESVFHRSEAELAAALSDKRALENDVAELRAQLAKVAQAAQAVGPPSPPPSPHPGAPSTPLPSPHPGGPFTPQPSPHPGAPSPRPTQSTPWGPLHPPLPSPHPGDPFTPLPPPSPHPGGVWGLGIPRDLTRRQAASPAACPACPGRGRACGG